MRDFLLSAWWLVLLAIPFVISAAILAVCVVKYRRELRRQPSARVQEGLARRDLRRGLPRVVDVSARRSRVDG